MNERLPVDLIFDIGKTNKKLMLFNDSYEVVLQNYTNLDEVEDDDGYLGEDLGALTEWMRRMLRKIAQDETYQIRGINISAYGASVVNLDRDGKLATPFYNYTKPLPEDFYDRFFQRFGDRQQFALSIASPLAGMLNSGLQLYYLQEYKPQLAEAVSETLHLPQYLSYLITGQLVSDYTSLGCHTGLWDFNQMNYHQWVEDCGFTRQLAPIVATSHQFRQSIEGQRINVGVGVHDSSAALLPYMQLSDQPFILVSTGTWSVSLNPFNEQPLSPGELTNGCLCYMSQNGQRVKASRIFLGKEVEHQVEKFAEYFHKDSATHKDLKYDARLLSKRIDRQLKFHYQHVEPELFGYHNATDEDLSQFRSFEEAYHHLMDELTDLQVVSVNNCLGETHIQRIYIDGGFSSNELFTQLLANKLSAFQILSSSLAIGSSLGAALLINQHRPQGHDIPVNCTEHAPAA